MLMFIPEKKLVVTILLNTLTWVFPFLGVYIVDALLGTPRDYCAEAKAIFEGIGQQAGAGIQQMLNARAVDSAPSLDLAAYAGRYACDLFGEIEISVGDEQLVHRYGSSGLYDATLTHWEHDTFLAHYNNRHTDPEFITFVLSDEGTVSALDVHGLESVVDRFQRLP
jgi:hypothetical protein